MVKKVAGVYLAAGVSSRMGQNKLAMPWKGKPLGAYGLKAAVQSQLDRVYVILNPNNDNQWVIPWKDCPKVRLLFCLDAEEGLAASIRCGVDRAEKEKMGAVIVQLADQPMVTIKLLNGLLRRFRMRMKGEHFIGYIRNGIIGPPILFDQTMFSDLKRLKGDKGARAIIMKQSGKGLWMKKSQAAPFIDIDTIDDFRKLPR